MTDMKITNECLATMLHCAAATPMPQASHVRSAQRHHLEHTFTRPHQRYKISVLVGNRDVWESMLDIGHH